MSCGAPHGETDGEASHDWDRDDWSDPRDPSVDPPVDPPVDVRRFFNLEMLGIWRHCFWPFFWDRGYS